jgi:hypothetical protein
MQTLLCLWEKETTGSGTGECPSIQDWMTATAHVFDKTNKFALSIFYLTFFLQKSVTCAGCQRLFHMRCHFPNVAMKLPGRFFVDSNSPFFLFFFSFFSLFFLSFFSSLFPYPVSKNIP